jgi:outer membrane receptor protein involved in Fe transport
MAKSFWLASACILTLAVPAHAQEQEAAAQETEASEGEIIITATRRAEALSDVPIAVSAISAEQLQNSGVTDIRALNQLAPSLIVSGATSEVNFTARIRGVGTVGENPGLESSVALFVDGVYRSRTGVGLTELGEVERIEVLRGPQGTLSGRNSSAGALNIVTAGPKFDLGGYASATYGNYDYIRIDGGVTGPLFGDTVAARIDGVWQERDGFIKNVTPGESDINDRDRWLVRGQLLFEPNDDVSLRIIGDYAKRDENCCGAVLQSPVRNLTRNPTTGEVIIGANTLLPILQTLGANYQLPSDSSAFVRAQSTTPGFDYRSDSTDWGISGELNWDLGGANLTAITAYRNYRNAQGQDADFNAVDILRRTDLDRQFKTFTQEIRLQGTAFNDRLDWLVGAYYADESLFVDDDLKYGNDYERYANCLLIAGVLPTALLPTDPNCINLAVLNAAATATGSPVLNALRANPLRPGFGSVAAALGQPGLTLNNVGVVRNIFEQDSRNYAFFTHNVVQIVPDKLSLTVGLRYTNEKKDLTSSTNTNNTLCSLIINSPLQALQTLPCVINNTAPGFTSSDPGTTRKEDEWTGTAVLSFKPNPDLLIYGSFSRGYKAGGFNLDTSALDRRCNATFDPACAARLALPANTPGNGRPEASDLQFDAEKVDAYEIGVKWDGPGVDVNFALFRQEFDNFQLNTFNGVNFEVTNLQGCKDDLGGADSDASPTTGACAPDRLKPGVVSEGFELETFVYPAPNLSLNGGLTYLDSRYSNNLVGTNGRPLSPVLFQLPGRRLFSSEWAFTGAIAWTPPVSDSMSALVYLDMRYQSDTNTGSDLDLEKVQDGYAVFNGRLGLYGEERRWGIELWGQNLFGKKYQQISADTPLQGGGTFRAVRDGLAASANQLFINFPGEPRTYGVTVKTKF